MVAAPAVRFVTSNPGKFREVAAVFAAAGVRLEWRRRTLPEPQSDTLEAVVRAKLAALPADGSSWVVDDSGLFLPALRGFPGVYSAYALRSIGLDGILRLLAGRPRSAIFRTVAGVRRGARVRLFRGECRGVIVPRPRGDHGFGYDPIFQPSGWTRTFGEVELREKNAVSHRSRAMVLAAAHVARTTPRAAPRPSPKER